MNRIIVGLAIAAVLIAAVWIFAPVGLSSFTSRGASTVAELAIAPKSLSFTVDATGTLRATSVQNFGAPPEFNNYWQFQIVSMTTEGKNVKKDDLLIKFDAQKIRDDLQRFQNELDQAIKELEKTKVQIDLERQELVARLANSENKHAKFKLKHEGSSALVVSSRDVELDRLALEQARRETAALKDRIEWHRKSSEATYNIIASKKARAENKVNEIKKGIEGFDVKADRDGVVVYKLKWNGERFQVGENSWSGQPIMEIPDLNTILAEVFVPEVDIGKVKVGQRAEITIDALTGKTYTGKVKSIGTLVRPKAYDIQNKILEVQVALDKLDISTMRPSMSIKGKIETGSLSNVIAVPLKAVRNTAEGARVKVKTETGWRDQKVKLGESNGSDVVITEGLASGESIAVDFAKAEKR